MLRLVSIAIAVAVLINQQSQADEGALDLYFIDVEGGAATLIVTPQENLREFEFDRIEAGAEGVLRELDTGNIKNIVLVVLYKSKPSF